MVYTQPNFAFTIIRDDFERYFWWSMGGVGLSLVPHVIYGDMTGPSNFVGSYVFYAMLLLVFITLCWYMSKHGTRWRVIFSVLSYTVMVITIPVVIYNVLITELYHMIHTYAPILYYAIIIWALFLVIKAIKVINNRSSTWKAIKVIAPGLILTITLTLVMKGLYGLS